MRLHQLKTKLLAVSMACLGCFSAQAVDIYNWGFETPVTGPGGFNTGFLAFNAGQTFDGWTVIGSGGNVALVPTTEYTYNGFVFASAEGSQWLDLTGDTDNGASMGVQRTFATVPGLQYLLSFYVGDLNNANYPYGGAARVFVQLNGSAFQTAINNGASGMTPNWTLFNYNFTATGTSTTLAFVNGTAGLVGMNGLDGVSVVSVPEPSAFTLLGLSVASLLRRRRRN